MMPLVSRVFLVLPGSPLFCGCIQRTLLPGNQLTTIGGIQIRSLKETHDALEHRDRGKDVIFTVMRGGMRQEVTAMLILAKE